MTAQIEQPAEITQGEWDEHRGRLLRTEGLVAGLSTALKRTGASLDFVRIEMRELRKELASFKTSMTDRLDKHSDWRETTGKHDVEQLQKQIEKYEAKEERRVAMWVKVLVGVAAAIAEAGILHWLKW